MSNEAQKVNQDVPSFEQTVDQILQDWRISKEELHELSEKYKSMKDSLTEDTHARMSSLMKESITGMLKEYTLNDTADKAKLETMLSGMQLGFTLDKAIDNAQFPIKVKLDGNTIRPIGTFEWLMTTENEHSMDMQTLLGLRKSGHIRAALKNGFHPIASDKKAAVTDFIEEKFSIMNAAIDARSGSNESGARRRAQEAYSDIIYCVMNGWNMDRPSGAGEKIRFRMNGNDMEEARVYLLQLINKDIPNARVTTEMPVENPVTKLLEATQSALNGYARKNGYSSIELKATDIFTKDISLSQVKQYQLIINKDIILANGQSSPSKPVIIDGISLQKSHLGSLKTEQELYQEIIKKVEDAYKVPLSTPDSAVTQPAPAATQSHRTNTERQSEGYNQKFFKANKERFASVESKLKGSSDSKVKTLATLMDAYLKDQSSDNAWKIQTELNSNFRTKLNPDKDFWPLTLSALEKIVGIKSEPSNVPSTPRTTWGNRSWANQPPSLLRRIDETVPSSATQTEQLSEKGIIPTGMLFRDGAYYMIGKDGKQQKIEYTQYSQSSALKENIEAQKARLPLVKDISIFLEAYSAENPKESQKVDKAWKTAMEYLQNWTTDIQKVTNQIVVETLGTNWGSAKWYDMFAIKDDSKRRLELYNLIKGMGQYDLVVQHIANGYTHKLTPENIKAMRSSIEQWGNYNNYISQKSADKIAKEMTEIKSSYQKAWNENRKSYIDAYKAEFKISTELTAEQLVKAEADFMDKSLDIVLRTAILKNDLNNQVNWKGDHKDPAMDLASSILGTGTFNMSSRMARESSKMIAIEAIALAAWAFTMGAWTVAIHALSATRFARLATLGSEAWGLARFGMSTIGNGVAFEVGHWWAKSLIEWQNMYSQRGFIDSILFTWVLGAVSKYLAGTNKLAQWTQVGGKWVQFAKWVMIEGTALNIAGVSSKIAFQDDIVWSPEEIAQAFLMTTLLKGAKVSVDKFKATKNNKGELEIKPTTQELSDAEVLARNARSPRGRNVDADINARAAKQGLGPDGRKTWETPVTETLDPINVTPTKYQWRNQDASDVAFKDLTNWVKYYGSADKLVIARNNMADIQTFQTKGYDLTPYGFNGWNIVQVQQKWVATYRLSHKDYWTHAFSSPKDVQTFLLTWKIESRVTWQSQNQTSNIDNVLVINSSAKDVLNRDAFKNTKVSTDGLTRINLDSLWLEWVIAVKYKNSGKSDLQYKIEWLNPKDDTLYSLSNLQKRVEEIQRSRNINVQAAELDLGPDVRKVWEQKAVSVRESWVTGETIASTPLSRWLEYFRKNIINVSGVDKDLVLSNIKEYLSIFFKPNQDAMIHAIREGKNITLKVPLNNWWTWLLNVKVNHVDTVVEWPNASWNIERIRIANWAKLSEIIDEILIWSVHLRYRDIMI